eukprot:1158537-Pelagomonas_calceolata.AAC.12
MSTWFDSLYGIHQTSGWEAKLWWTTGGLYVLLWDSGWGLLNGLHHIKFDAPTRWRAADAFLLGNLHGPLLQNDTKNTPHERGVG